MQALINRMKGPNGSRLLIAYKAPGSYQPHACYIESPYSEEDGRTVGALMDRGILKHEGEDLWVLSAEYL